MSKDSKALGVSAERNRDGPDFFGYYACQAAELLSNDENFMPLTSQTPELPGRGLGEVKGDSSLFSNGIGVGLSDVQRERLKALLRQSVIILSAEADEMLRAVIKTSEVQRERRKRGLSRLSRAESKDDKGQDTSKKLKLRSSDSSTSKSTTAPEESKVNDDLQFLLENSNPELEKIMMKFCDDLLAKLGHMQQQLEKLLDVVMSTCRPMAFSEKKQLQKMIKELPCENLDRVAELVKRGKQTDEKSDDEIYVDLEKESIVTLWRLHYYVKAVEKSRKLSM